MSIAVDRLSFLPAIAGKAVGFLLLGVASLLQLVDDGLAALERDDES